MSTPSFLFRCCFNELIIVHSNSVSFSSLRSLFARRVKENQPVEQKDPGWKLFGKVPLRESPLKDPKKIQKVESVVRPGVQQNLRGFILCVACGTSMPIELPERMETWAVVASASDLYFPTILSILQFISSPPW